VAKSFFSVIKREPDLGLHTPLKYSMFVSTEKSTVCSGDVVY